VLLHRSYLHVLAKYFVRIKRFGIYNASTKRNLNLKFVVQQSPVEKQLKGIAVNENNVGKIIRLTGFDVGKCDKCMDGRMYSIKELARTRSANNSMTNLINILIQ